MTYTIEVAGLTSSFGAHRVLRGVDLRVRAGSVCALLGSNGAGKTTVVRILATLRRADGGHALVGGHDVATHPARVRGVLGLTGQYAAVDQVLTGRENLRMMCALRHLGRAGGLRRTAELLDRFRLDDAADRPVSTYSGGMRRRLDIALGLVGDPSVVILDEPTTGLDPRSRREVWDLVGGLRDSGVTVLLTTQYLEEAAALADRVTVLHDGRVVADGTTAELTARVGGETVELRFVDAARRDAARAVLADVGRAVVAPPGDVPTLRVPIGGGAEDVRALLELLHGRGVPAAGLDVRRPTLDEVFLDLTAPRPRGGAVVPG